MTNKPIALTSKEIKEIAAIKQIQELWGAENAADMELTLKNSYTVRFDFMNGSPGYVGDLFIIQPDHLASEIRAIRLIRNQEKQLEVLE
jgi:hypothetical protein